MTRKMTYDFVPAERRCENCRHCREPHSVSQATGRPILCRCALLPEGPSQFMDNACPMGRWERREP